MRKIVCGCFGTIYDADILKSGIMGSHRRECTDECLNAVVDHVMTMEQYQKHGRGGYMWDKSDGSGHIVLRVYDDTKYELVQKSGG